MYTSIKRFIEEKSHLMLMNRMQLQTHSNLHYLSDTVVLSKNNGFQLKLCWYEIMPLFRRESMDGTHLCHNNPGKPVFTKGHQSRFVYFLNSDWFEKLWNKGICIRGLFVLQTLINFNWASIAKYLFWKIGSCTLLLTPDTIW